LLLLKRAHLIEHKQLVAIALHLEEIACVLGASDRCALPLAVMRRVIPPPALLDLRNPASMQALDTAAGIVEQRYQLGTISPLSDQRPTP
jgi:hypothetical protein